ncbi:hypothetical protein Tco_0126477 [Tanacetum coccineum]
MVYLSRDSVHKIERGVAIDQSIFSPEFIDGLKFSGVPNHILACSRNGHWILTTDWNAKDMDNIIRVLHVFYLALGLQINIHKSNIYGIGVNKDEVLSMASNAGCIAGDIPFNYLGLPIGSNMNVYCKLEDACLIVFDIELSYWKANLLFDGGVWDLTYQNVLGSLGLLLSYRFLEHRIGVTSRPWERNRAKVFLGFIKTIFGEDGALNSPSSLSKRSLWIDIIREVTVLRTKGISLLDLIRKKLIDDSILPKEEVATKWVKVMPIKINVFAWRVRLDKLPTRLNIFLKVDAVEWALKRLARPVNCRTVSYVRLSSPAVQQLWTLYPGKQTANLF